VFLVLPAGSEHFSNNLALILIAIIEQVLPKTLLDGLLRESVPSAKFVANSHLQA
jgi:hypothetical protein